MRPQNDARQAWKTGLLFCGLSTEGLQDEAEGVGSSVTWRPLRLLLVGVTLPQAGPGGASMAGHIDKDGAGTVTVLPGERIVWDQANPET